MILDGLLDIADSVHSDFALGYIDRDGSGWARWWHDRIVAA
jgi:hypothetical protein